MARLAGERETVGVVDGQAGQPTWTRDVADAIHRLVAAEAPGGPWHATSAGETTWCGLARAVFSLLGLDPSRVQAIPTSAYPRPAPRPAYSVLGDHRWAAERMAPLRPWTDALAAAWPSLGLGG